MLRGRFPQLLDLDGLLRHLPGMFRGRFPQLLDLDGLLRQLPAVFRSGFRQFAHDFPQFVDLFGQLRLPLRHRQQFGTQQPTAEGFRPLRLFLQNPVQVGNIVNNGRAGLGHKANRSLPD